MVARILEDLRADHRTTRKLLEMLQRQIELVADDREPDGALLLEIVEYFRTHPELFHQPKEEMILRRVIVHDPHAADAMDTLKSGHESCRRALNRLTRSVVRLLTEPAAAGDRFLSAALAFLDCQHRHLAWEEQNLFAVAERTLTEAEWSDVEMSLNGLADPMFERDAHARSERIDRTLDQWRKSAAA